jgi:hypothetical protein
MFKFELGWIQREGFQDMIKRIWERPAAHGSPIQRWRNKMHALRKHMSSWAHHTTCLLKKGKQLLTSIIDDLESIAEVCLLSAEEIELKTNPMRI